jgi:Flp pilus assembly protein TadD
MHWLRAGSAILPARRPIFRALEINPADLRAWRVRGAVRERLNDDAGAAADYGEAIQRDPKICASTWRAARCTCA